MAFLVILLSPWSPHCPRHPHIIPVIPTSSLCRPCHPHIVPIAPEGPHVVPMAVVSVVSSVVSVVSTPCCRRGPHVVPIVPTSSPYHPCHPHIIPIAPRRSPCGPHDCGLCGLLCCLRGLHPMLSPWSPRRLRRLHIVPVSSLSSPHRLEGHHIIPNPSDTHSTHPPPPKGVGDPKSVKMQ